MLGQLSALCLLFIAPTSMLFIYGMSLFAFSNSKMANCIPLRMFSTGQAHLRAGLCYIICLLMRTYFIIIQTCNTIVQFQQLYFIKYHIVKMSNWKLLVDRNKDNESSYSGSKPQKYTPKKAIRQQQSPLRFHNQTVDKMNSSQISGDQKQKPLGRSFVGRPQQAVQQSRGLKSSSSEIKLHKDGGQLCSRKNTLQSYGSLLNNNINTQSKNKNLINKNLVDIKIEKTILFEEIQKLKKQFIAFQSTILRELHRQQKILNSMIEQILTKLREGYITVKKQAQQITVPKTSIHNITPIRHIEKKDSIDAFKQVKLLTKDNKVGDKQGRDKEQAAEFEGENEIKNIQNPAFQRFFQAMNNLKKQIKDLTQIGDVSSMGSPKSALRNYNWDMLKIN